MTQKCAMTYSLKNAVPNPLLPFYNLDVRPEKSPLHPNSEIALKGDRGWWEEQGQVFLDDLSKKFHNRCG